MRAGRGGRLGGRLGGALGGAADLVWAAACAGCGRAGVPWCPGCRAALAEAPEQVLTGGGAGAGVPVLAAAVHAGAARALLLAVKEGGRAELRPVAAELLAGAVGRVHDLCARADPLVLVPVPSRWASRRRRGGDLVADLAARAAALARAEGGRVRVVRGLRLRRRVVDQAALDRAARQVNVAGALRWAGPPPDGPCAVLDDVVTTGATAREAVRALRAAGADVRAVVALTCVPR
ncbi:ComF family protein [Kineococcus sp. NUM-3379]